MDNKPPLDIRREVIVIVGGAVILLLLANSSLISQRIKQSFKAPLPNLLPLSANKSPLPQAKALPHFTSCEDLQAAQQKVARPPLEFSAPGGSSGRADTSAPAPITTNLEYSRTNIQVEGVDEPDIVKTDGRYIFAFSKTKRSVAIVQAAPAESVDPVGRVNYPSGTSIHEFFLEEGRLAILGHRGSNQLPPTIKEDIAPDVRRLAPIDKPTPVPAETFVDIWDVTNPRRPSLERSLGFEGTYLAARLANDTVYVALNGQTSSQPVPMFRDSATNNTPRPAVACNQVQYIEPIVTGESLLLAGFALDRPSSPVHTKIVIGGGEKVYMSPQNFYIAGSQEQEPGPRTTVHKFALDAAAIEYIGQVSVAGRALNQFSMDEYDGYFRLATTSGQSATTWSNNLFVIDDGLTIVGKLTNLAPQEQIYSARFMGTRAYLVTFRQTDPLFAIDLTDPTAPQALGELKLPGFSQYLHPYDANHLIGIGKHATDQGRVLGVKVALFDVADVGSPKQIDVLEIGGPGADSEVLRDHKALLFDQAKHLLVLPIHLPANAFSGVYVLDVSPTGFNYRQRLSHSNAHRSLYIDNTLYTLSDSYLNSYDLSTLTPLGSTGL